MKKEINIDQGKEKILLEFEIKQKSKLIRPFWLNEFCDSKLTIGLLNGKQ